MPNGVNKFFCANSGTGSFTARSSSTPSVVGPAVQYCQLLPHGDSAGLASQLGKPRIGKSSKNLAQSSTRYIRSSFPREKEFSASHSSKELIVGLTRREAAGGLHTLC